MRRIFCQNDNLSLHWIKLFRKVFHGILTSNTRKSCQETLCWQTLISNPDSRILYRRLTKRGKMHVQEIYLKKPFNEGFLGRKSFSSLKKFREKATTLTLGKLYFPDFSLTVLYYPSRHILYIPNYSKCIHEH